MGQIWKAILWEEGKGEDAKVVAQRLPFKQKAVYHYWNIVSSRAWKLDKDPVASAKMFIAQKGGQEHIAALDVRPEPGTECVAFYVTDFVEGWAENTQELAMDSTCECDPHIYANIQTYHPISREYEWRKLRAVFGCGGRKRVWNTVGVHVPSHDQRSGTGR